LKTNENAPHFRPDSTSYSNLVADIVKMVPSFYLLVMYSILGLKMLYDQEMAENSVCSYPNICKTILAMDAGEFKRLCWKEKPLILICHQYAATQ